MPPRYRPTFALLSAGTALLAPATSHADVRIAWDHRSRQTLGEFAVEGRRFTQRHYPRVRQLRNGDLLLVFMDGKFGWQIFQQRSRDGGRTWSPPRWVKRSWYDAAARDRVAYCNPELLELRDGTLLLAYQRRNNRRSDQNEGVEVMRSADDGGTWSEPVWAFRGKNWEPSLLQLPSGEVQMLFTDTREYGCSVGMARSLDGGRTWLPRPDPARPEGEYLSRSEGTAPDGRAFSMDGMAVGVSLRGGKGIVYAAECDLVGKTIRPTPVSPSIVWSSLEKNWRYPDFTAPMVGPADRRWAVHPEFHGYAPYLIQLSSGEVVVQSNGRLRGTQGMWTFVGDGTARNFHAASRPFGEKGFWGSVTELRGGRVLSAATTGANPQQRIVLVTGVLNRPLEARPDGNAWFVGGASQAQGRLSATADAGALTLRWAARDEKQTKADGFRLRWVTAGGRQTFRLRASIGGGAVVEALRGPGTWARLPDRPVVRTRRTADGYTLEVAVPWRAVGGHPCAPVAAHLELLNSDAEADPPQADGMPGEDPEDPAGWLAVRVVKPS